MKGEVRLIDGVRFQVTSGSGHSTFTDGPPEEGGKNLGMRPMEMVLLGMGGCTAFDVVQILRKRRREPKLVEIEMEAVRAQQVPKVFTSIHLKYRVRGDDIKEREVRRAIDLSLETYCSATRMLASTAKVTYELELLESPNSD
ncbi:MAG: OsmC family protein [Acidiferrobacterales bacterium]|nr:OsmC family protein [Acidiferrobacterales bacterium]